MINLFQYQNSHDALKALVQSRHKKLSIRGLSKKLGYSSDRTLGMALQGRRLPSPLLIQKLSNYYELSFKEKNYLRLLGDRDRLRSKRLSDPHLEKEISDFQKANYKKITLTALELQAVTHWAAFVIVEIFQNNPKKMRAEDLLPLIDHPLSLQELEDLLKVLTKYRFIQEDENFYFASEQTNYFYSSVDVPSKLIREAHRRQITRSLETLESQSVLDREFSMKTFTVPKTKIPEIKKIIRDSFEELSEKILALNEDCKNTEKNVYQMNIQLYRQSKDF